MSGREIAVASLLFLAIGSQGLCCFGLLVMRNTFDRLHAIGPAALLSPMLVAAAVVAQNGFTQAGIKSILVAFLLIAASPVVTHVLARAAHLRGKR